MQLLRKLVTATLYVGLLFVLNYLAAMLAQTISRLLPSYAWIGLALILALAGIASYSYFFYGARLLRLPLTHAVLRKLAAMLFAILGLLSSVVVVLLLILMQRAATYTSFQIAAAISPWLVLVMMSLGVIIASRLAGRDLEQATPGL